MNKKIIAKEYLLLLKFLIYGYICLTGFMLFMTLIGEADMRDLGYMLVCPVSCNDSEAFLMAWLIIIAPYVVMNIIRSIKWSIQNK